MFTFSTKVLKNIFFELRNSFLHLFYPAFCLHCKESLPPASFVLCSDCASLLDLIFPESRCPNCFEPLNEKEETICDDCRMNPSPFFRIAAAFDYEGPAATLVKNLKFGNQPQLAKGMAGYLVAQFLALQWPLPDAIVPVPLSFFHKLERGYNQSELMANEVGKILNRPVWNLLKRKSGDFSQSALSLEMRASLKGSCFRKKHTRYELQGKILLIIDDVMTSGMTLQRTGEILQADHPSMLYALTFCRTL